MYNIHVKQLKVIRFQCLIEIDIDIDIHCLCKVSSNGRQTFWFLFVFVVETQRGGGRLLVKPIGQVSVKY